MEIIQNVFNKAENGDRILISFPDMVSFFAVTKWLNEQFGNPYGFYGQMLRLRG